MSKRVGRSVPAAAADSDAAAGGDEFDVESLQAASTAAAKPKATVVNAQSVVTMSFLQSYLAEIVDALKAREKKKEAKRQAATDERFDAQQRRIDALEAAEAAHQKQLENVRNELNAEWERKWTEREQKLTAAAAAAATASAAAAAAAPSKSDAGADAGVHVLPVNLSALVAAASAGAGASEDAAGLKPSEVERRLTENERGVAELRHNLDAFISRVQRDVADIALATRQSVLSMAREIAHMLALLDSSLSSIPAPAATAAATAATTNGTGSYASSPSAAAVSAAAAARKSAATSAAAADPEPELLDRKYDARGRSASPPERRTPTAAATDAGGDAEDEPASVPAPSAAAAAQRAASARLSSTGTGSSKQKSPTRPSTASPERERTSTLKPKTPISAALSQPLVSVRSLLANRPAVRPPNSPNWFGHFSSEIDATMNIKRSQNPTSAVTGSGRRPKKASPTKL